MGVAGLRLGGKALSANGALGAVGNEAKAYGSGYFGQWITDEFGLPAFRYTCDQLTDPKAVTVVNPGILGPTEHIHQVGNDRIVAIASNLGYVRVRQDEGAPKLLNDYAPERGCFGAGIGYLTDGQISFGTFYTGATETHERVFGVGYFRRRVRSHGYEVDHVIFAPYGDDPVLLSQVTVTNRRAADAALSWFEYWGCQEYQFSFRSFMEAGPTGAHELRREFASRFKHHFRALDGKAGLLASKEFLGYSPAEEQRWRQTLRYLTEKSNPFMTAPQKDVSKEASFDDLSPPPTFLLSLDAPADAISSNGEGFFGSGDAAHPRGLNRGLDGDLTKSDAKSALLLERRISLRPGEHRTMTFLYGYLPKGSDLEMLVEKQRHGFQGAWRESSLKWKKQGMRLRVDREPWVERETTWNHYYLRSSLTFDSFFGKHILSQGAVYQYVMGFQGAARDPLQHALPLIFSDPDVAKEVLVYTLKQVRSDGSIPYGIVGHGMPMPTTLEYSSDIPLWLLWAVSEYVLATRNKAFLNERIATVYGNQAEEQPVVTLLTRCFRHLTHDVGTGEHGLMRMLRDDWNDALVTNWVPPKLVNECVTQSESVLNSAMASYVYDRYAELLAYTEGEEAFIADTRTHADRLRKAVHSQWTGKWFRRAWLGPTLGWLGERGLWLEQQPWALLGGGMTKARVAELLQVIDRELRQPSPIGALQMNKSPDMALQGMEPGTLVNGGVSVALNATLIWVLARANGDMAWEEWKKNSLARHADVYPEVWYGTWSGPDLMNSVLSEHPGETTSGSPLGWTDFPVLNIHSHANSLFAATKLLGLEFTANGLLLAPSIPLASYSFESQLLGFKKSASGYEGWYQPASIGTWRLRLRLPAEELKRVGRIEVNGERVERFSLADGVIEVLGKGGAGTPLRWSVRHV